jgi:hypothetical protein
MSILDDMLIKNEYVLKPEGLNLTKPARSTHIIVVLDESASMRSVMDATINGYNEFIANQQRTIDGSVASMYIFSDKTKRPFHKMNLASVEMLNTSIYKPNGQTALYDAIGQAIEENRQDRHAILAIQTDGNENASKKYSRTRVRALIKEKEAAGWEIVYLSSSSLSADEEARIYGLDLAKVKKFAATSAGMGEQYRSLTQTANEYRANLNK